MRETPLIAKARETLNSVRGTPLSLENRQKKAVLLSGWMLEEALSAQSRNERQIHKQLSEMLADSHAKNFTTTFADQCFRSDDPSRIVNEIIYLMDKYGVPSYLPLVKKLPMYAFRALGKMMPTLFAPIVKKMLRKETANVIIPGEADPLKKHMLKRRKQGIRVNLNHLGEAILGEEEACKRLDTYLKDLKKTEVDYISIKISTICSQINLLAPEETLNILIPRLRQLYRAAIENPIELPDGTSKPKFVNLDMEEYRDLNLTVELFRRVLDEEEFQDLPAGIVLQAYLPDAYPMLQELTHWARARTAHGGSPIKVRLVKGANLAMEQVESALHTWPQAPYTSKRDVDANWKRMLLFASKKEHAQAVHIGIGSHNLFDIAFSMLLRSENEIEEWITFEMLEGMADPMRRVVHEISGEMLLYCPVAEAHEFQNAVAYLIRRLDENSAPQNFLRHAFNLEPGSIEWDNQVAQFNTSCRYIDRIPSAPRRTQDRSQPPEYEESSMGFSNEPDTDWALPQNVFWIENIIDAWKDRVIEDIPIVIDGKEVFSQESCSSTTDPSKTNHTLFRYALATSEQLEKTLASAKKAENKWQNIPPGERSRLLQEVTYQLQLRRSEFMGAMVMSCGKTAQEADIEYNEAIDFIEYYRRNLIEIHHLEDISWKAKGTVVVAPPWNFPASIPTGGVAAALSTGNCVIFKPAREAILIGWMIAQAFWEAGIPKDVLQFLVCDDEHIGSSLISDTRVNTVILTGATETGNHMLKLRSELDLIAETGGKNSIIVTKMADRDLAVKEIIHSAFGHAGQKCSACSLAILESEVYHDPAFRRQLRDAASSLAVGSAWDLNTRVNPLIHPPEPKLLKALTTLETGEEWLLEPVQNSNNPQLWSPGIKLGVKEGSTDHQTEFFGPMLGVMCADDLDHAIRLANGTNYGLTSGLHSLDEREHVYWQQHIIAGNCYINRSITGAVVQRQPFGGTKASSFGRGIKAGGPNYLMQLMHPYQRTLPIHQEIISDTVSELERWASRSGNLLDDEKNRLHKSVGNYAYFWKHYFARKHDPSLLLGQDNFLEYRPETVYFFLQEGDELIDILCAIAAGLTCQADIQLCGSREQLERLGEVVNLCSGYQEIDESGFLELLHGEIHPKVRLFSQAAPDFQRELATLPARILSSPVLANGRIELLNYLREVITSIDYHRYGNLGTREGEQRTPLPERENKRACASCDTCGCGS